MERNRPAWREPMVWLVAALPLTAVIATIALLVAASRGGSVDAVRDPVQRTAQIQVADLGPDALAQQLRLSAVVRTGDDLIEVLPVSGDFDRSQALRIALRHPTRAAADRDLVLRPSELGWRSADAVDATHDWIVQLSPSDGRWRLQGRLLTGQRAAHLKPALSSNE